MKAGFWLKKQCVSAAILKLFWGYSADFLADFRWVIGAVFQLIIAGLGGVFQLVLELYFAGFEGGILEVSATVVAAFLLDALD